MNRPPLTSYAVTDTNVMLDIYSCHDVSLNYDALHGRIGVAALDDPSIVYRRARARESLFLAMHFHKVKAVTYSLHSERVGSRSRSDGPSVCRGPRLSRAPRYVTSGRPI